jgi:hypothetical protein
MSSGSIVAWRKPLDCLHRCGLSMMDLEYLRKHIDALVALSHDVKDRAVSVRRRELADECRIILSLADVSEVVAGVIKSSEVKPPDE